MGLLDQVLGQVLGGAAGGASGRGGGGQPMPGGGAGLPGGLGSLLGGKGGPIALAILAMLASRHMKGGAGGYGSVLRDMLGGGGGQPPSGDRVEQDLGRSPERAGTSGGGILDQLGGMLGGGRGDASPDTGRSSGGGLGGGLGGALGGGMLGGALGGGLNDLLERFRQNGQGDVADSWVGSGPNRQISAQDLESAIGPEEVDDLSRQTGMGRDAFLSELSDTLPKVVDGLTPDGRPPTDDEASRWV